MNTLPAKLNRNTLDTAILAKPLYINYGSYRHIGIDSAKRLKLIHRQDPRLDRRIPLQHIKRIVCDSRIHIDSEVWLNCLEAAIPLCIQKGKDHILGWAFANRQKENTLHTLLLHGLDDPEWDTLYTQWLQTQCAANSATILILCQIPTTASNLQNAHTALCNHHQHKRGRAVGELYTQLKTLLHSDWASHLAQEIGDPELLYRKRPGLQLPQDLLRALELYIHIDIERANQIPDAKTKPQIQRFYEHHQAQWCERMAALQFHFEQFCRQHWQ